MRGSAVMPARDVSLVRFLTTYPGGFLNRSGIITDRLREQPT